MLYIIDNDKTLKPWHNKIKSGLYNIRRVKKYPICIMLIVIMIRTSFGMPDSHTNDEIIYFKHI